jgi:hypothetical protein
MKAPGILQLNQKNYALGARYCRENMAKREVSIFVKKNLRFKRVCIYIITVINKT